MGTPLRVLLVEDSEDDAELTRLELEHAGYDLMWQRVDTEQEFAAALDNQLWDAIISDYQMPEFNGLRAFDIFRAKGLDTPFIFVSGELGEERAVEAMRRGARDYIVKGRLGRLSVAMARELSEAENRRKQAQAEEAMQREQRCMAIAMEATGAAVIEFALLPGTDLYFTGRWADMLGYKRDELPAHGQLLEWFTALVHPLDLQLARRFFRAFIEDPSGRFEIEVRVRHKDGQYFDVACMARALEYDKGGRAARIVGVMMDLTERKKLEAQLRHAQKMEAVGSLAGGVAHDFNNLLTVILGYAELLRAKEPALPAPEAVDQIYRAAGRAAELTRKLLAFSRKQIISPRVLDLNTVVGEMSPMIRRLIGEDIDFLTQQGDGLRSVNADPGQVEQIIMNLVVNARDAMPEGGKLTLETGDTRLDAEYCRTHTEIEPGPYVMLAVSDTGSGMDAETLGRIFEPFFTTKERGKGTGLGLATVYGIVKQNRGHISVYSEPGKGTTFKIYWPITIDEKAEEPAAPTPTGLPRGTETILLAEDEDAVRTYAAQVLRSLGYAVIEATDGVDAIARAHGARIDLLVTDVVMPRLGGRDLAAKLNSSTPGIKVVYCSGYTSNAIVHHGVLEHGVNFLAKPYSPQQIAQAVRATLDA